MNDEVIKPGSASEIKNPAQISPQTDDPDDSSRVPEQLEYYSGTVLTFLVIAAIGFAIGALGMMLILG